jgi:hypothetical protein
MPDGATARFEPPAFVPDRFFLARTRGRGLVRDFTGRLIDTCAIATEGRWDHAVGALRFDEVFSYDDGRVDTLSWAFSPDPQGRMVASEPSVAGLLRGWPDGADYRLRFKRADPTQPKAPKLTYDVRFSLMQPDLALKVVKLRLFGVAVATMTAFHRQARV